MTSIPLVSSDAGLNAELVAILDPGGADRYEIAPLGSARAALDFLAMEMPELIFVNFSDGAIDAFELLAEMLKDPWLLHGGIIALCADQETVERINGLRGANIIVALTRPDLPRELPRVMGIVKENRRILFHRGIGQDIIGMVSGSFRLHNNLFEANTFISLICNYLYNVNKLSADRKYFAHLALYEMLVNAIEHGNCGITYDEKTGFLEGGGSMPELIERKSVAAEAAGKAVTLEYTLEPSLARFLIADEGSGFDWRATLETVTDGDELRLHGRGILITRELVQNIRYNDRGNEVTFEIAYDEEVGSLTPALFTGYAPVDVSKGDTVIRQGDASNELYFIIKGRYDIVVDGSTVSSLSADDLFMGEMSFLLNDRRSATVVAATDGKLVQISKLEFVRSIREKPQYALFLARLLAQRLQRLNAATARR